MCVIGYGSPLAKLADRSPRMRRRSLLGSSSSLVKVHCSLGHGHDRGREQARTDRSVVSFFAPSSVSPLECAGPSMLARWTEKGERASGSADARRSGGDEETRTPDFLLAKEALYQLSYVPLPIASAPPSAFASGVARERRSAAYGARSRRETRTLARICRSGRFWTRTRDLCLIRAVL